MSATARRQGRNEARAPAAGTRGAPKRDVAPSKPRPGRDETDGGPMPAASRSHRALPNRRASRRARPVPSRRASEGYGQAGLKERRAAKPAGGRSPRVVKTGERAEADERHEACRHGTSPHSRRTPATFSSCTDPTWPASWRTATHPSIATSRCSSTSSAGRCCLSAVHGPPSGHSRRPRRARFLDPGRVRHKDCQGPHDQAAAHSRGRRYGRDGGHALRPAGDGVHLEPGGLPCRLRLLRHRTGRIGAQSIRRRDRGPSANSAAIGPRKDGGCRTSSTWAWASRSSIWGRCSNLSASSPPPRPGHRSSLHLDLDRGHPGRYP